MLVILINWLYIGITAFLTGYAVLGLFARLFEIKIRHTISYIWAGLLFATVYAQTFSLFAGVALPANMVLSLLCVLILFWKKDELLSFGKETFRELWQQKWYLPVTAVLILLMAYGTSRGYMHFDTGLYHAQSIRWIEEYGVVPGLANVQARFGYNSAAFPLTALYSMKAVFGQSLHATAGFFALLGAFSVLDLYKVFSQKRILLSDFVRIGLLFYLCVIFSEMMSPASDYYAQILLFVILILWLEEDEFQKRMQIENAVPYGLLCVLIVYAVTIKFSVAVLLLFVIKPAVIMIKNKNVRQIGVFLGSGLLTCIPFFIRNVIISGWLVYPFEGIDLFSVDWKIPKGQVYYDAMEIGLYGKGITDVTKYDTPFSVWFPAWFMNLKSLEKIFVLMTVAAIVSGIVYLTWRIVTTRKNSIRCRIIERSDGSRGGKQYAAWKEVWDFPFVFGIFVISAAFWFVSAPLIRYGYSYVVTIPLLTFGFFFLRLAEWDKMKKYASKLYAVFCVMLVLFLLTRIKGVGEAIIRTCSQPYYITQQDYDDHDAVIQMVGTIPFYVPEEAGQIGYKKFPSSVFAVPIEMRGDSIKDGFRQIQ